MVGTVPEGPLLPAPVSAAGTYTIKVGSYFLRIFLTLPPLLCYVLTAPFSLTNALLVNRISAQDAKLR